MVKAAAPRAVPTHCHRLRTTRFTIVSATPFSMLRRMLAHLHGGGHELVEQRVPGRVVTTKTQHTGRALLHAGRASHAFRVLHGQALVREAHDVDALVTNARANIARDAFLFLGEDAEFSETRIDVHQRGQRAGEAAPDAAAEP